MEGALIFLSFLGGIWFLSLKPKSDRLPPLFISLEAIGQVSKQKDVLTFASKDDTLSSFNLELLSNKNDEPLVFYAHILTPICIDTLCKPIQIGLYWNLLGSYIGYGTSSEEPLTKFDHELFTDDDLHKLHLLLLDDHSILRRKELTELYVRDTRRKELIKYNGKEIDGITGATIKAIKNSVIDGALYSSYAIWHLAHGEVTNKILGFIQKIYTPALENYFLHSSHSDYQLYALQHLTTSGFRANIDHIITIINNAPPLSRTYILKEIPTKIWSDKEICDKIIASFSSLDVNSKTILIDKLNEAHPIAVSLLSAQTPKMSKNQLKSYLKYLTDHPSLLDNNIKSTLDNVIKENTFIYAYLIEDFLQSTWVGNK